MKVAILRKANGFMALFLVLALQSTGSTATKPIARWALRKFKGVNVAPTNPEVASLIFAPANLLGGTAACNSFIGGRITWSKGQMQNSGHFRVDTQKDMIWTTVACISPADSRIGGDFWSAMDHAKRWSVKNGNLVIIFDDGTSATFKPVARR